MKVFVLWNKEDGKFQVFATYFSCWVDESTAYERMQKFGKAHPDMKMSVFALESGDDPG